MHKETMSEIFRILDHEEQLIANEGHALAAYFRVARKTNAITGELRKEWSKFVFVVRVRPGKQPQLEWHRINPKQFIGAEGKKIVVPQYVFFPKNKPRLGSKQLRSGDDSFSYRLASFKGIMLWEKYLIMEVEEQAAKLRERLWRIRVIRKQAEAYLTLAKSMSKDAKKYRPYIMLDAQAKVESLKTKAFRRY